jgi:hypothetical protein
MIALLVGAIAPHGRLLSRSVVALCICFAVEFSQLIHTSTIDAIRSTALGNLVLGSGFNARDLGAYAIGVVASVLLETMVVAFARKHVP